MSRSHSLPGAWGELADRHGGVQALADKLGVKRLAVYRYAHGLREPGALIKKRAAALMRAAGLEAVR